MQNLEDNPQTPKCLLEGLMKYCTRCGVWKRRSEYHRNNKVKDGLQPSCKVCRNWASHRQLQRSREKLCEQKRAWNAKNAERLKPIKKRYYLINLETVRERSSANHAQEYPHDPHKYLSTVHKRRVHKLNNGGSYTPQEWEMLCAKYGHRCLWCDQKVPLTVDHVIPISRGGSSAITNLQPLCEKCNKEKHNKIMDFRPFHDVC